MDLELCQDGFAVGFNCVLDSCMLAEGFALNAIRNVLSARPLVALGKADVLGEQSPGQAHDGTGEL